MTNKLLLLSLSSLLGFTSCDKIDLRSRSEIAEEKQLEREKQNREFDTNYQRIIQEVDTTEDPDDKLALIQEHLGTDYIDLIGPRFNRDLKLHLQSAKKEIEAQKELAIQETVRMKAEQARLEQERIEEENRAKEQAAIIAQQKAEAKREADRLAACQAFKGTKLDKITLQDGTVYEDVTVSNADAIGISIRHTHGIKRIPFALLPEDIRETCHFDPKAADRKRKLEARLLASQYASSQAREKAENAKKLSNYIKNDQVTSGSSSKSTTGDPKAVRPRGTLSVRAIKYSRGLKELAVTAQSNVNATLTCNLIHVTTRSISPGTATTFNVTSGNNGFYEFVLRDNESGKVLDRESSRNKTGF